MAKREQKEIQIINEDNDCLGLNDDLMLIELNKKQKISEKLPEDAPHNIKPYVQILTEIVDEVVKNNDIKSIENINQNNIQNELDSVSTMIQHAIEDGESSITLDLTTDGFMNHRRIYSKNNKELQEQRNHIQGKIEKYLKERIMQTEWIDFYLDNFKKYNKDNDKIIINELLDAGWEIQFCHLGENKKEIWQSGYNVFANHHQIRRKK